MTQLAEVLNQTQDDFEFVLRPTSLNRRFADLLQGRLDMVIFENPDWGWQGIAGARIDMGLEDAEIFITQSEAVGGSFFDLANDESGLSFQPLADIDRESERMWALDWLCDYMAEQNVTITPELKKYVREALESLASCRKSAV